MKSHYSFIVFILINFACYSQKPFDFNQGEPEHKNYYTAIPYENVNGKIIVTVDINGKKCRFIFDTGASNMIAKSVAKKFSFPTLCQLPITDANGRIDSMAIVSVNSVKLGDVVFNNIPTIVSSDSNLFFSCFKVDGFIGSNMLRNSIIRISSIDNTIILTDLESKFSLNKKTSSKLILTPSQSRPFIQIDLKNDKNEKKEELLFDSGMDKLYCISLYHYSILQRNNIFNVLNKASGANGIGMNGVSGENFLYRLRLPEMNISGAILQNVSLQTTQGIDAALGSELLDYGVVTIDYKNKRFYFEPYKPSINLFKRQFQVDPIIKDDKVLVGVVWNEKLKNEIEVGDQILKVDTINYEKINPCNLLTKPSPFKNRDSLTLTIKNKIGLIKLIKIGKE